jgi:acetyl-CoA C-acetyltransferase
MVYYCQNQENTNKSNSGGKNMREAVIVEAARTPIGRGYPIKGWLSGLHAIEVLSLATNGVIKRAGIERSQVEQVVSGTVTQAKEKNIKEEPCLI